MQDWEWSCEESFILSLSEMLFNSFAFLLYLPLTFLLYWCVSGKLRRQNCFVVVASYVFYGWWDRRFVVLIAFATLLSYLSGILLDRLGNKRHRRIVLSVSVVVNLAVLGVFKYYNFFVENLQALLSPLGVRLDDVTVSLILPVGISFYTFQALSYSIDVYRGRIKATRDAPAFFAFISFFPQLVAGPIERATNLLPQFMKPRKFDYPVAVDGCRQILWGLFKKMVVADNCAVVVNQVFADYESFGGLNLWLAAVLFAFQIYGDFSGYSDIAIGTAKLFGIRLMRNFNIPYFSRDVAEFWRRWHISLTPWFRDYIYIPLGGSRCRRGRVVRNTFVIFLVSGLWHGAEWTFVAWGVYHAMLFVPLILSGRNRKYTGTPAPTSIFPAMGESLMMAQTFLLVLIGWVIFRADTLTDAFHFIARMFTDMHFTPMSIKERNILWLVILIGVEWVQRHRSHAFDFPETGLMSYRGVRWTVYYVFVFVCLVFCGTQGSFIYFQF